MVCIATPKLLAMIMVEISDRMLILHTILMMVDARRHGTDLLKFETIVTEFNVLLAVNILP